MRRHDMDVRLERENTAARLELLSEQLTALAKELSTVINELREVPDDGS